ncbi:hypothetical protein CUMW_177780 [Citrus unshiu]|uniref:Transposase MuDR plant domain-containing protein n=1 Tax=Citrus unshiu TaxID=55188 RepID=A0A2H5PYV2_CITUN|nr:hypothetical protein CUMW_177780 [Citrus unshiu]
MLYKSTVILTKALLALVEFKYWREPEFKVVIVKYGHNEMDLIEISVVLPWTTSRQRKLISNDSELYLIFEEFFTNSCPVIEFEVHTGSCGYENPVNIGASMGSDKFEKLSEDGFIGGYSFDEENGLSQMYESIVDNEWQPNLNGSVSLKVGNTFESVALLREIIVKYAIQEGFELNRITNDGVRHTCCCVNPKCTWKLHASSMVDGITFKIMYIKGKHDCQIKSVNKDATSPWITKVCAELIQINQGVGVNVIRSELKDKHGIELEAEPSPNVVVPVGPPDIKALVGRPKKKRTKELDEAKLTGKMFTNKCSACRCLRHNKRGRLNFPKTTRTIEGSNKTSSSAHASDITSSTAYV